MPETDKLHGQLNNPRRCRGRLSRKQKVQKKFTERHALFLLSAFAPYATAYLSVDLSYSESVALIRLQGQLDVVDFNTFGCDVDLQADAAVFQCQRTAEIFGILLQTIYIFLK